MYIETVDKGLLHAKQINILDPQLFYDIEVLLVNGEVEHIRQKQILSISNDSVKSANMGEIVYKNRLVGGYKYLTCTDCKKEIAIEKPVQVDMPYCGDCGKAVLDIDQNFCCWCGVKFTQK